MLSTVCRRALGGQRATSMMASKALIAHNSAAEIDFYNHCHNNLSNLPNLVVVRHYRSNYKNKKNSSTSKRKIKKKKRHVIDLTQPTNNERDDFDDHHDGLFGSNDDYELYPGDKNDLEYARDYVHNRETETIDEQLQMMDYFTSQAGTTEDYMGERRSGMDVDKINQFIEKENYKIFELDQLIVDPNKVNDEKEEDAMSEEVNRTVPENQLAHGEWGELLVSTDRVKRMWRGGRIESYRALVIGGNLNGCAGFGVGKGFEAEDAVEQASRNAKRNIFFVDRYLNCGLSRDLVGRQNSCRVYIRATDNGLRGNALVCEVLKFFGISNAVAKSHGNRNDYNVVRATFKALATHESLEEISLKRGTRLVNLQKAKRLQV